MPWNCPALPSKWSLIGFLLHRTFRRTALDHAEGEETSKRGEAKHQRGLLAGEVGRHPDEVLDGLLAQILRERLRAVRRAAHEAGELRRVLIETLGGGASSLHDVVDHVGA